jgi:hypothetical protein
LPLLDGTAELRKLVGTARVDFAVGCKDQSVGFTAGDLPDTLSYHLGKGGYLIFFRVLNRSQLVFSVVTTHKEGVRFAYKA